MKIIIFSLPWGRCWPFSMLPEWETRHEEQKVPPWGKKVTGEKTQSKQTQQHNNKLFQVRWAMVQLASSRFLINFLEQMSHYLGHIYLHGWLFLLSAIYIQGSSTVLFLVRCSAWSSSSHFGLKSSFYGQHCFKNFFMEMTRAMKATFIFSIIATNFYYLSFIENT